MALAKGTNSYVTVAEADAYFSDRLDAGAWDAADATQKAKALVTATSLLDEMAWAGAAVSESQSLAFPRDLTYYDTKLASEVVLENATPTRILTATYELAYHLLNNDGLLDDTGGVESISVGTIVLNKPKNPNLIPSYVKLYIKPLLLTAGSRSWWRAN